MDIQDLIDAGVLDPTDTDMIAKLLDNPASKGSTGSFIPPGFAPYYKEPFTYNVNFPAGAVAANAVASNSTNVNNDSYFCWYSGLCTIFDNTGIAGNVQPNLSPLLVNIKDTSSGKFLMDSPTPIGNIFGTGLQPVTFLYRAKVFNPGGQISVEVTNPTATVFSVRCQFTGFKIYKVMDDSVRPAN